MSINSLSYSSRGMAGLASGMDTESMVKKLLAGTQTKIDRQTQKKTQLTYKQEMYRGVTSKLRTFKDTYFSYTNPATNLLSSTFFNSMNAKYTSSAFKATATSQASAGTTVVDKISRLAEAAALKSNVQVSGGLAGAFNEDAAVRFKNSMDGELVIAVGDAETKSINISALAGMSNAQAEQELNRLLTNEGIDLKVLFQNGSFAFSNAGGEKISITAQGTGAQKLLGTTNAIAGTGSVTTGLDTEAMLPSVDITLDGVKKTVYYNPFDVSGNTSASIVAQNLEAAITKSHGGGVRVAADGTGKLTFTTTGSTGSRQIQVGGTIAMLDILGLTVGQSNKINTNLAIEKLNFSEALVGDEFKFTINGVDFNVTGDRTLGSVISEINNSKANVKIAYNATEDKFTMTSTTSGEDSVIQVQQKQGNLLSALFGNVGTGSDASSVKLYGARAKLTSGDLFSAKSGTMHISIDGTDVEIEIPEKQDGSDYTARELIDAFNAKLANGADTRYANIRLNYDSKTGEMVLSSKPGTEVIVKNRSDNLLTQMGFSGGETTLVTGSTKLSDLGITQDIYFKGLGIDGSAIGSDWSIDQMTTVLQAALRAQPGNGSARVEFDESSARFRVFGVDIPMDFQIQGDGGKLFGATNVEFNKAATVSATTGKNALFTVNGIEIERNSNNFTLNGIQFELLTTTQKLDEYGNPMKDPSGNPVYDKKTNIDITRDTDKIYDGIVKFVEAYNEIVKEINGLVKADATYKDYPPLTAEEKAQLSDREVELWEKKSKEGLLRSDSTLLGVLSDMRRQIYQKSSESGLGLYNIGITTSVYAEMNKATTGTLTLDHAKLRTAINENAEEISKLFTADDGVAVQINNALDRAVSSSSTAQGTLVKLAGMTGSPDTNSSIYKQIKQINSSLADLEDRYESEYNRYWKQFTAMEQMIQNMNQQSSWLAQQFSS